MGDGGLWDIGVKVEKRRRGIEGWNTVAKDWKMQQQIMIPK